jgi:hypothetical protein
MYLNKSTVFCVFLSVMVCMNISAEHSYHLSLIFLCTFTRLHYKLD